VLPHLSDAVVVLMIPVIREFIPYPQADENGYGHAGCQAGNVDERIAFLFDQIAKGDFEVILEHGEEVSIVNIEYTSQNARGCKDCDIFSKSLQKQSLPFFSEHDSLSLSKAWAASRAVANRHLTHMPWSLSRSFLREAQTVRSIPAASVVFDL
jgi:hypothetical protein